MEMECIYFSDPPIHNAEDVDEDEEQSYEERHPSGNNFRRDEEADPGHHHEQPRREVVERDVLELVAGEEELDAGGGEVADPVALVDADVVRGELRDVGVELEDDAPPPRVVVEFGGRELDGAGGAGRVEAQGALVRVQRVRVEPEEDERPNSEIHPTCGHNYVDQ